jgi:hypothetical protein
MTCRQSSFGQYPAHSKLRLMRLVLCFKFGFDIKYLFVNYLQALTGVIQPNRVFMF